MKPPFDEYETSVDVQEVPPHIEARLARVEAEIDRAWAALDRIDARLDRQILPHAAFAGSVLRVPVYDPEVAPEAQQADAFMGVYAPTGVVCEVSAFLAGASQCDPP